MKVAVKHKENGQYVRLNGTRPGDWQGEPRIEDATIFDLSIDKGSQTGIKWSPFCPFDLDDYNDRERMADYILVHVKVAGVTEDN